MKRIDRENTPLPNGWKWARLAQHAEKIGSGATPRGGQSVYVDSGIPFVRSQNVHLNAFTREGLVRITPQVDESMSGSRVADNDVLLNITGASIGRACAVPAEICPANVNQHVCVIRPAPSLDREFLAAYLCSPGMQKHISDLQAGATRQALTKAQIEDFPVPLPPLAVQERISAHLTACLSHAHQAQSSIQDRLDLCDTLIAAILRESVAAGGSRTAKSP